MLFILSPASAQSDTSAVANNNAYAQPFATLFGSVTNSGWYQSARVGKGFGFYIGIPLSITHLSGRDRTYDATYTEDGCVSYHELNSPPYASNCSEVTAYKSPTIFGGTGPDLHLSVYDPGSHAIIDSLTIKTSDGLVSASNFPFLTPQMGFSGTPSLSFVTGYCRC